MNTQTNTTVNQAINIARETAVADYLNRKYGEERWVRTDLTVQNIFISRVRTKHGRVQCEVENEDSSSFVADFKNPMQGEFYVLYALCNHFKLLTEGNLN